MAGIHHDDTEYILKATREQNIHTIRLWFTDILGFLKSIEIPRTELENVLENGQSFDGSSIEGYARVDESDMIARPDPASFQILPGGNRRDKRVARMFCDIYTPEGTPYPGDPRQALKRNLKMAREEGYTFYIGTELEYYYFKTNRGRPEPLDSDGYFDLTAREASDDYRQQTVIALEEAGIGVESSHHEGGPGQHEIDLRYCDALTMAENVLTFRLLVKEIARNHGIYASMMPRPLSGQNGNGMHTHQSLFKKERNIFFDSKRTHNISRSCEHYIAGLLQHAPEFTLVTNQWINSYKRLVKGFEAPIYTTWAIRNYSDLVRVPSFKKGRENSIRVELRSPDPACNPYLAFSCILAAGLAGIKNKYPLPPASTANVHTLPESERQKLGIRNLPGDLNEAIRCFSESELMRKALGDHLFNSLIENKRLEWEDYRRQVSRWEMKKYFRVL